MLRVFPASVSERVHEHLDRLTQYREVQHKVVSLVQAESKWSANDATDCYVGAASWAEEQSKDINALANQFSKCPGFGHYQRDCWSLAKWGPTPNVKAEGGTAKGGGGDNGKAVKLRPIYSCSKWSLAGLARAVNVCLGRLLAKHKHLFSSV